MSELEGRSDDRLYGGTVGTAPEPESVLLPGHDVPLGRYTTVRRLLPQRERRMVGAWCFVDHLAPRTSRGAPGCRCRRTRTRACRRSPGWWTARSCTGTAWAATSPSGRDSST